MIKSFLLTTALCSASLLSAQLNITQLGHLDYQALRGSDLSNLWGYTDELGNEYALVGVNGAAGNNNSGGLSIVDVTDPANPQEIFFASAPNSIWREIKVWDDHAYITTEAESGLLIVDLSPLPQSTNLPTTLFNGQGWITSHSLFIDENGRLYLNGSNRGAGGVIMYDLTQDPMAPVEVGEFDTWYVHDCFARGDTLYAAHIYNGFFSIVDVSDPAAPELLGTQTTPSNFTHNVWLDDSGHHLFTTDEQPNSYLASYDVSDPSDIQFEDQLQTGPGSNAIIHNTYWLNDYVVQSYYTEGVSIYDVADPSNIVEVGHYDTSPFTGDGFNGAWGVYPFAPSGNLYVSDIEGGLYILGPQYVQACRLEGIISNAQTSAGVVNATLSIVTTTANDLTSFDGAYSTGWATAGTYQVSVSAPGFVPQTVDGVVLQNGQVTVLNVQLVPLNSFAFGGQVIEEGTTTPVADAQVLVRSAEFTFAVLTDVGGNFTVPVMFDGSYTITAGKWGYRTICLPQAAIDQNSPDVVLQLPLGYADDFALDLGWSVSGDAETGDWERGTPVGTTFGGQPSNPDLDVPGDCLNLAYVTGNAGGQAGQDDVDNGTTVLTSPVFDVSGMPDPWVRYYRWYFNGGGNGTPNDTLFVRLSNGSETVTIETVTANSPGNQAWSLREFSITDVIAPTSTMQLIITASDLEPGHLVEAGLDQFEVLPQSPFFGVNDRNDAMGVVVYPSPNDGSFTVEVAGMNGTIELFDVQGRAVITPVRMTQGRAMVHTFRNAGVYVLRLVADDGRTAMRRIMIR
jgi:choice-of-anchor B domain-containing protein